MGRKNGKAGPGQKRGGQKKSYVRLNCKYLDPMPTNAELRSPRVYASKPIESFGVISDAMAADICACQHGEMLYRQCRVQILAAIARMQAAASTRGYERLRGRYKRTPFPPAAWTLYTLKVGHHSPSPCLLSRTVSSVGG